MRILFLALDIDLSKQRGDTVHAVELARAFRMLGHQVTMVVGAEGSAPHALRSQFPICVVTGSTIQIVRAIRTILKRFQADVVYERRSTPKIGAIARMLWNIPCVLEVNGILREELAYQGRLPQSDFLQNARRVVRKALYGKVNRFVVVSQTIGADLVSSYGIGQSRVFVIGNGVDTERFRPEEKREACRVLGLDSDLPRIVFVGNLVAWRDFDVLFSALQLAQNQIGPIQLVIVGSGQEFPGIERRAISTFSSGAVVLTGEIPHEQVSRYIAAADICLLPEKVRIVEISPIKLFEYLACGRPVVAFDVPGLSLIEELGVGRLVPAGNATAMATAICTLLADANTRSRMGSKGRDFVVRERSWRAVASRVSKVLADAVASK